MIRYPAIAACLTPFQGSGQGGRPQWTDTALKLLDRAPDRTAVLSKFMNKFVPTAWAGSRAAIIELNSTLLEGLVAAYPELTPFVENAKSQLEQTVKIEHDMERLMYEERNERFEW